MIGAKVLSFVPSTAVPSPFLMAKVTVGFLPGAASVTLTMLAVRPLSCFEATGRTCAPLIEASNSLPLSGTWQLAQALSSAWMPPTWFAPVAKLMLSWQEPHALRDGLVNHTSFCAGFFVGSLPS